MNSHTLYQKAIQFAASKHSDQTLPGSRLTYVVHLSNVAMEIFLAAMNTNGFDLDFALQVALLHDTIEDTSTTYAELKEQFGDGIANAVLSLTKNKDLPKEERMRDSLNRIRKLPNEVWAVKMADRITNLQPPPHHWDKEKKANYREEARLILSELRNGNDFLATRLKVKIEEYVNYF
jgi:guanosine-3',5'-bis(diphosphate) 3'-pyrophosphohydrolase